MYKLTHVRWVGDEIFIQIMNTQGLPYHYETKVVVGDTIFLRDIRKRGWGWD